MMHVLLVDRSQSGIVGGSLTGLIHLMHGLDPQRYRSTLVLYEDKDLGGLLDRRRYPVVTLNGSAPHAAAPGRQTWDDRPGRVAQARRTAAVMRRLVQQTVPRARALLPVLRRERPDVVHAGNCLKSNLDAVLAARWAGIPCVVHEKGFGRYTVTERILARTVTACICMTDDVRAHLERERVHMPHTVVVYDGIDLGGFRPSRTPPAVRPQLGLAECEPLIGMTSNVSPWKGQDVLVRAVAELVGEFPRLGCLVVGGIVRGAEEFAGTIEAFVKSRGLERHVRLTGARSDIPDVVGALDVLVHASIQAEPFGRVLIEAMALGRPVVATAGGGVPEIVVHGETGLLVPPGDTAGMAAALRILLADPALRARLGAAGARRARERFSLESHVSAVEGVYAAAVARTRRDGASSPPR